MTNEQVGRFKAEFEVQKVIRGGEYTYVHLAEELGYSPVTQSISRFIAKKEEKRRGFKEWDKLAEIWGVTTEYLKCESDCRTKDDLLRAGGVTRTKCIDAHLYLLEIAGYKLEPRLYMFAESYTALAKYWEVIQPTLTDKALSMPINDKQTFKDWNGKDPIDKDYLEYIPVRRTWAQNPTDGYNPDPAVIFPTDGIIYSLEFEYYFKDGKRSVMTMDDLENLFVAMDERNADMAAGAISQHIWKKIEIGEPNVAKD